MDREARESSPVRRPTGRSAERGDLRMFRATPPNTPQAALARARFRF